MSDDTRSDNPADQQPARWRNRIIGVGTEAPDQLLANPKNFRIHPKAQQDAMAAVLDAVGYVQHVIVNQRTGFVVDGHLRVSLAISRDEPSIPVVYVDLSDEEEDLILTTFDPIGAMAATDRDKLSELLGSIQSDDQRMTDLLDGIRERDRLTGPKTTKAGKTDPDDAPPERPSTNIQRGDLFRLGQHLLLCGDSSNAQEVDRVLLGDDPDLLFVDPPYCSGGFQEAGKASGSIGTRSDEMIHNDTLSTRGYIALMKTVITNCRSRAAYVFTDWRMWINLFDVMESSGYGVRNMIVWDKETPGMGAGWRMQHELIMAGITARADKFDPKVAQGNVIKAKRTGNILHPTQKPVDLLEKVLHVSNWARIVVDAMAGSGSTLIACETQGISCRAIELSPSFCQVIIDRWESFTGQKAEQIGSAGDAPSAPPAPKPKRKQWTKTKTTKGAKKR